VSPNAKAWLLERVREARLGSLGTVGAAMLLFSTVLALRHLETTLNEIWGVRNSRSWMRRFADYLAVMIVAPILTAVALSLATTFQSEPLVRHLLEHPLFSVLYAAGLSHAPQAILLVAFTFLYWFFPNTNVRLLSAALGGAVAAVLFSLARSTYVDFNLGAARYGALFGAFSALPLVLAWLWVCWAIVLLGAEVAFAHQNLSHYRREVRGKMPGAAEREAMGLRISVAVARAFRDRSGPVTAVQLSEILDLPVRVVRDLLESFEDAGLLAVCAAEERERSYMPARPLDDIHVGDLLAAMRGPRSGTSGDTPATSPGRGDDEAIAHLVEELDAAVADVAGERSLAAILAGAPRA
jgi:membrane protein